MSFLVEQVKPVYQEGWFIGLISALGAIIAIVATIFLVILIVHFSEKRQIRELENRYSQIHSFFTSDCVNSINRIETISKNNSTYIQILDSVKAQFTKIITDGDKRCYLAVSSLKELVGEKKYKGLKQIISSTKQSMDEFEKSVNELNDDLQNLLKPEEECRSLSVALKEKYRNLKAEYEKNTTELATLAPQFNKLFNFATKNFSEFEDALNSADYDKAKKILPKVEEIIDATSKVMDKLPYLNTLCDKVIPARIQELENEISDMNSQSYPLHHLHLNAELEWMKNELSKCKKRLNVLSTKGVEESFNAIIAKINFLVESFKKEKAAKEEFDKKALTIDSSTYECEKKYANLQNNLNRYCEVYKIEKTYLDQIQIIKGMIDEMSTKKRTLDSYINSSTRLPYSTLITNINDLNSKVNSIQKAFDDFHVYLLSLKKDSEKTAIFINETYTNLLIEENKIRKAHVETLSNVFNVRIDELKKRVEALYTLLNIRPIDVMSINSTREEIDNDFSILRNNIKEELENLNRAENLIVYDNMFRLNDNETRRQLAVIENSFWEADFTRASTLAINIYNSQESGASK